MTDENKAKSPSEAVVNEQHIQTSLREDLDAGLRFLHLMGMQTKLDLVDMVSTLFALLEELVESGQLNRHLQKMLIPFYDWLSLRDCQLQISATLNAKIRV
jgi:hypothetical protein